MSVVGGRVREESVDREDNKVNTSSCTKDNPRILREGSHICQFTRSLFIKLNDRISDLSLPMQVNTIFNHQEF